MVLGEKVNKICARKVGDPAEVHTPLFCSTQITPPPNKHNLCALTSAVDKLHIPNPPNNMASLIMIKFYLYLKLDKYVDIFTCSYKKTLKFQKIICNQTRNYFTSLTFVEELKLVNLIIV